MGITIGVLGLQGAVREHMYAIEQCGENAVVIKEAEQLTEIDGLIIPGGESTTIKKLIDQYQFGDYIQAFALMGKPIFGTCAGLILIAKELVGEKKVHLQLMDVKVARNSFGRQRESFEVRLDIAGIANEYEAIFIRAPHIVSAGENVEILAKYNGRIVLAREGNILGCSFHPELTEDIRITQYFVNMVKESKSNSIE